MQRTLASDGLRGIEHRTWHTETLTGSQNRADDLTQNRLHLHFIANRSGRDRKALELSILLFPGTNPGGIKNHVAVDHLAGQWIGPKVGSCESAVCRDPLQGAIVDIFRIKVISLILPANSNGVGNSDLLKGFVPLENAGLNMGPKLDRDRIFHPPDDLLLGRAELGLRIRLLQVPAIDLTNELGVRIF